MARSFVIRDNTTPCLIEKRFYEQPGYSIC
jgi:hypothetical protein